MDENEARGRFAAARVAHLATVRADGAPHLVPIVFEVEGSTIVFAVDQKPKRTTDLKRLENIRGERRVSLLVDHYDENWDAVWWVRADGLARIVDEGPQRAHAIDLLAEKYQQYRRDPPAGPGVLIDVHTWRWWSAA